MGAEAGETGAWIRALAAVLRQGAELARGLEPAPFAEPLAWARTGSVGAHLRHASDFVRALLAGVAGGDVDYDQRRRDPRLELEPGHAAAHLERLAVELLALARLPADWPLTVRLEAELVPRARAQASTLAGELAFLVSHTIHHYALVAVLLRARGIEPGAEFGVAPSTLRRWSEEAVPCAPRSG